MGRRNLKKQCEVGSQSNLFGLTVDQRDAKVSYELEIHQHEQELEWLKQVQKALEVGDNIMLTDIVMHIERYGGRNLPFYLNVMDEDCVPDEAFSEVFGPDCKRSTEYDIGSYWRRTEGSKGTLEFIKDRCAWAEKYLEKEINQRIKIVDRIKRSW